MERVAIALLCLGLSIGCAKPRSWPTPVAPAAIDLEPRCGGEVDAMVPPGTPHAPSVTNARALRVDTLALGTRWIFDSSPNVPLATLHWGVPLRDSFAADSEGARDARLAAALLQSGETTQAPEDLRRRLHALGAMRSAQIDRGWLWLGLSFPDSHTQQAFRLFRDWLEPHAVAPEAFDRIRRQTTLVQLAEDASPKAIAAEVFRRVHPPPARAATPTRWGNAASESTPAELQHWLDAVLRPERSVAIHSGSKDATSEKASFRAWIDAKSRTARAENAIASPQSPRAQLPTDGPAIYIVDRPAAPQVEILVGLPTVATSDPDFVALEIASSLLGADVGGRLFRDLRERQGLAYIINAEHSDEGRFAVVTSARHERVGALLLGIEAHLRALVELPLEPCEVAMLERRMLGEEARLADSPVARGKRLRSDIAVLGAVRSQASRIRELRAALRAGLEGAIARHLDRTPTIVLVGDAEWLEHDLARALPGRPIHVLDGRLELER